MLGGLLMGFEGGSFRSALADALAGTATCSELEAAVITEGVVVGDEDDGGATLADGVDAAGVDVAVGGPLGVPTLMLFLAMSAFQSPPAAAASEPKAGVRGVAAAAVPRVAERDGSVSFGFAVAVVDDTTVLGRCSLVLSGTETDGKAAVCCGVAASTASVISAGSTSKLAWIDDEGGDAVALCVTGDDESLVGDIDDVTEGEPTLMLFLAIRVFQSPPLSGFALTPAEGLGGGVLLVLVGATTASGSRWLGWEISG